MSPFGNSVILAVVVFGSTYSAAASEPMRIRAAPVTAAIQLDGKLDEADWRGSGPVARLTQQAPRPGEPTEFDTEVRVLYDASAIFVGFRCTDPQPRRISVRSMERDPDSDGEDTVTVVLDPYGDRRTGYFFRVNAAGARSDGLIADPENASRDWDGNWDARISRDPTGWTAEIRIPIRILNYSGQVNNWGLNLEREVARERLTLRWASATLDSFLYDMSRAGELELTGKLDRGLGVDLAPYGVGRVVRRFDQPDTVWQATGGADVTWRPTPTLATVLTLNTDFAETEVDARQINLTRFPLFFPEKRAFFLEGSNQFQFGLGLSSDFIPFFSRRIGLLDEEVVPIDVGVKVNGRVGGWNMGFLTVKPRDTAAAPATNLLAGRFSYDLSTRLRVGAIVTHGDPTGNRSNSLAGFDAVWRASDFRGDKNLLLGVWTAFSAGDLDEGRRNGWGFKLDYPNDLWDCALTWNEFGEALEPALGFLPRPGTRQWRAGCDFMPRPSADGRFGWVRQWFFESRYSRVTRLDGVNESWRWFTAPVKLELESGDGFEFNWAPQFEHLDEPFEIEDGVTIAPGDYLFTRWRFEFESAESRALRGSVAYWFGDFYDGTLKQLEASLSWTSSAGRYQAGLEVEQNSGRLAAGSFVQRLWQFRGGVTWNPNLSLSSLVQYDSESQNIGSNSRLRWTIRPGREVFIVWNRGWQRLILSPADTSIVPDSEFVAVKLRWNFEF